MVMFGALILVLMLLRQDNMADTNKPKVTGPSDNSNTNKKPRRPRTNVTADYDVLILGAGIAGVTAARTLTNLGINNFLLIEATEKVGGRIKETTIGDITIELGATWVPTGNNSPMYKEVLEHNFPVFVNDYDDWKVINNSGYDVTTQAELSYEKFMKGFNFAIDYRKQMLKSKTAYDFSIASILEYGGWMARNAIDATVEFFEIQYVTSFPGYVSSLRYFYGTDEHYQYDDEDLYLMDTNGGYSTIVRDMLHDNVPGWENKTLFNTVVEAIDYTKDIVVIQTNNGVYSGRFALITFSLGVLQHKTVKFVPALPGWKESAIFGFNMGYYTHLYLRFPSNAKWFVPENTEWISFASDRKGYFPVWQNLEKHRPGCRLMYATVTNNEAERLNTLSDSEIQAEAMGVLRIMFGGGIPEPEEMVMSRWIFDQFTYGSYPDWPAGYSLDTFRALQAPVGPMYFAGDAYDNAFGFVNGAYAASIRETTKLVQCLIDQNNCVEYTPQ